MRQEEKILTAEGEFMIRVKQSGDFKHTEKLFEQIKQIIRGNFRLKLEQYGKAGVKALAAATPVDSGKTADSWDYEITEGKSSVTITWTNSNRAEGVDVPIAILLQYGHATGNGSYVQGIDYINPALRPLFDEIARKAWEEVTDS